MNIRCFNNEYAEEPYLPMATTSEVRDAYTVPACWHTVCEREQIANDIDRGEAFDNWRDQENAKARREGMQTITEVIQKSAIYATPDQLAGLRAAFELAQKITNNQRSNNHGNL